MKFPIHPRPQLVSQSLLVGCSELRFHPAPCARFDFSRSSFPRRGGSRAAIFSKFSDEADGTKANLNFDVPTNYRTIALRSHGEQIHFTHPVFHATNRKEAIPVQPLFNKTFAQQRHTFSISGCCSREKDQKRSANFVIAGNAKCSAHLARRGGRT